MSKRMFERAAAITGTIAAVSYERAALAQVAFNALFCSEDDYVRGVFEDECRKAIVETLKRLASEGPIVYLKDDVVGVYLVVSVQGERSIDPDAGRPVKPGDLEYQVSNGPPGKRSASADYYDLDEAVQAFKDIVHGRARGPR